MIDSVHNVSSLTRGAGGVSVTSSVSEGISSQGVTPGENTGLSFASVLGSMTVQAMDNVKQAEISSYEGIQGTASTREVVDAVLSAEQSLQTAIALRDKIVSAYLEITKMQI